MTYHILAWFILMIVGILNGILRELTYGPFFSDLTAHQISTFTGILFTGLFVWLLWKYRPLESSRQAWIVGAVWFLFTICFEFGFGHFVMGHSWERLFNDYNLLKGRIWSLFLAWIGIMPFLFFRYFELSMQKRLKN